MTTSGPNSLSGVDAEIFSQPVADGGSSREEGRQLSGPRAVTTHLGEQLQSRQSPRGGRIVTFPLRDQPVNDTVGVEAAADDRRREGVHTVGEPGAPHGDHRPPHAGDERDIAHRQQHPDLLPQG